MGYRLNDGIVAVKNMVRSELCVGYIKESSSPPHEITEIRKASIVMTLDHPECMVQSWQQTCLLNNIGILLICTFIM